MHLAGQSVKAFVPPTGNDSKVNVPYSLAMPPRIKSKDQEYEPTYIRAWREHRGLSQDELVDRCSERVDTMSKSSLSRIENGQQPYSQPILEALAWALNCSEADLLERDPKAEMWQIVDKVKKIRPDRYPQVADILDTFPKAS